MSQRMKYARAKVSFLLLQWKTEKKPSWRSSIFSWHWQCSPASPTICSMFFPSRVFSCSNRWVVLNIIEGEDSLDPGLTDCFYLKTLFELMALRVKTCRWTKGCFLFHEGECDDLRHLRKGRWNEGRNVLPREICRHVDPVWLSSPLTMIRETWWTAINESLETKHTLTFCGILHFPLINSNAKKSSEFPLVSYTLFFSRSRPNHSMERAIQEKDVAIKKSRVKKWQYHGMWSFSSSDMNILEMPNLERNLQHTIYVKKKCKEGNVVHERKRRTLTTKGENVEEIGKKGGPRKEC